MEKRVLQLGVLWLGFMGICASPSFADFDYTISHVYLNHSIILDDESAVVEGAGVKEIIANGASYIEVQNTLPLKSGVG